MFDDAVRHYQAGRLVEADRLFRIILRVAPRHADSLHFLGLIAYRDGCYDTAVELIGQAIRVRKNNPFYHFNLATVFLAVGRTDDAVEHYERAIVLKPDYADAYNNLANIIADKGKFDDAMACYGRVFAINPDHAVAHNGLANVLKSLGRIDEAVAYYKRAILLWPDYADAHNNLASVVADKDKSDDAIVHYERALTLNPDHAEAHSGLGSVLQNLGRIDEAMAHYDWALAIKPDYAQAHFNRSQINTFHAGDPDLAALEAHAGREDLSPNSAMYIHFALAKALEDSGNFVRAFEHMGKANALKRQQIFYDESAVLALFQRISTVFNSRLFERFQGEGDSSLVPVFVLGMPRSGSSLVEQILASHPQIHGAGELTALEMAVGSILNVGDQPAEYPECVAALDGVALRRIGQAYVTRLAALADDKARVIDKFPGNFLHIGLIRLMLPNAKIIHIMRDPIDTCLSCYSKLFVSGLHFSYDLAELGRYYRCYHDLMAHWRTVLPPGTMIDVFYEDVVNDLEGQARRMVDYCGLPWDERCLDFHRTSRPVKTASATQVRKPIFRSSLQRWRRYEAGIVPLLHELRDIIPGHASVRALGTTDAGSSE
jgi:tetratricopeptide (TPR) repeat protein